MNGGGSVLPSKPNEPVTAMAVYAPSRKLGLHQVHGNVGDSRQGKMTLLRNGKRRRVSEDAEMMADLIKTQIFAYGKKPEIKLTLFSEMYSCSDCCELFYTEMGLIEHHQREVFNALLKCPHCSLQKYFANRCQLLNHLKSHGVSPTVESLKGAISFHGMLEGKDFHDYSIVIPTRHPGHMPTAPTTIIPSQLDVGKTELQKTAILLRGERQYKIIPVNNLQKTAAASTAIGTKLQSKKSQSLLSSKYFCSACGTDYTDGVKYINHIKKSISDSSEILPCSVDGVPILSQCELDLHVHLFHDKVSPFICPECGQEFEDFDTLEAHDRRQCFHFQKVVIYSCGFTEDKKISVNNGASETNQKFTCASNYTKINLLIRHFQEHSRDIHKCPSCPQALLTAELLHKHVATLHADDPAAAANQQGLTFVQCLICQVIFVTQALFQEHLQVKLKEHCKILVGFHCSKCLAAFEDSTKFGNHSCLRGNNDEKLNGEGVHGPKSRSMNSNAKSVQSPPIAFAGSTTTGTSVNPRAVVSKCIYCKQSFPSVRALKRHLPSCDSKLAVQRKRERCKLCSKSFQGPKSFLMHGISHLNAGMNICLFCSNRALKDSEVLETHLMAHVATLKTYPHDCIFCDEPLQDEEDALTHFSAHHEKAINRFACAICGKHFDSVTELTNHKVTKHPSSSTRQNVNEAISALALTNGSPTTRNRVSRPTFSYSYQCKYCLDRKFQTRPGLRKHLRNHHADIDFTVVDWNEMRRITRNTVTVTVSPATQEQRRSRRDRRERHSTSTAIHRTAPARMLGTHSGNTRNEEDTPIANARTPDGRFQCLKCKVFPETNEDTVYFTTESSFYDHVRRVHVWKEDEEDEDEEQVDNTGSEEVRDHPAAKKTHDECFWCPECSLEFVVKPSFRMHLQFAHDYIKDVNKYMDNIGYGKNGKPVKENQCLVCRAKYSNSYQYQRHIRTHGMAFLKLQRHPSI